MIIQRCAWHKKYFKKEKSPILGKIDDGKKKIEYSDGMCERCSKLSLKDARKWLKENRTCLF